MLSSGWNLCGEGSTPCWRGVNGETKEAEDKSEEAPNGQYLDPSSSKEFQVRVVHPSLSSTPLITTGFYRSRASMQGLGRWLAASGSESKERKPTGSSETRGTDSIGASKALSARSVHRMLANTEVCFRCGCLRNFRSVVCRYAIAATATLSPSSRSHFGPYSETRSLMHRLYSFVKIVEVQANMLQIGLYSLCYHHVLLGTTVFSIFYVDYRNLTFIVGLTLST
ncbi:hypothetical protein E2C01_027643 [Portunus trituberculatus]|uniref:Uncharacterized protein n=1 Tax=Portunus trituberculatus TaxID=210409 RepID=A0A5B7ELQ1_PORTR|nr:hypothetical protein [Portunus trituberculatus]